MKKISYLLLVLLSIFFIGNVNALTATTQGVVNARNSTLNKVNTNTNFSNLTNVKMPRENGEKIYYFSLGCPADESCNFQTTYSGVQKTSNGISTKTAMNKWNTGINANGVKTQPENRWKEDGLPDVTKDNTASFAINAAKNKYSARYKNVGRYADKDIDVVATVVDFETMINNNYRISEPAFWLTRNKIGIAAIGVRWVKVQYKFFESGTNTPVTIKGNTTYWEIDNNQGVIIADGTNKNIGYVNKGKKCTIDYNSGCNANENTQNQLYYSNIANVGTYIFDNGSGLNPRALNPLYNDKLGSVIYAFTELFEGNSITRTFQFSDPNLIITPDANKTAAEKTAIKMSAQYWNGHGAMYLSSTPIVHEVSTEVINGTINPNTPREDPTVVSNGDSLTVTYSPNVSYSLYSVKIDKNEVVKKGVDQTTNTGYRDHVSFQNIKADHHVRVEYKRQFTITTIAHNGEIDPKPSVTLWEGESKQVKYYPWDGYYLKDIKVNGTSVSLTEFENAYDVNNIDKNYTIEVWYLKAPKAPLKDIQKQEITIKEDIVFEITHELENPGAHYTSYVFEDTLESVLEADADRVTFKNELDEDVTNKFDISVEGQKITATAKAASLADDNFYDHTYRMLITTKVKEVADLSDYIVGDKILIPNKAKIILDGEPEDTNQVTVEIISHKVTTSVIHGEIDPTPYVIVPHGEDVNVTYNPDEGYTLKSVWVDGEFVDKDVYTSNYLFENIGKDHEVRVVYDIAYTIETKVVNGTIDPDPQIIVAAGDDATITYEPNPGYEISEIIIDGESIDITGYEDKYVFTNVDANHHIKVIYTIKNVKTGLLEIGTILLAISSISAVTFIMLKRKQIKAI